MKSLEVFTAINGNEKAQLKYLMDKAKEFREKFIRANARHKWHCIPISIAS